MSAKTREGWPAQQRQQSRARILLLGFIGCIFGLPLLWALFASFGVQPNTPPFDWAIRPTLTSYLEIGVAETNFWRALATTMVISGLATVLTIVVAYLAAYALARSQLRRQHWFVQGFLILASLPAMAYIIPLSDMARRLHLQDSLIGIILAQSAAYLPFATYILCGYLTGLPVETEEAAILDGASLPLRLSVIVLPMITPGMIATTLIICALHWNALLTPMALSNGTVITIPLVMVDFFTFERDMEWSSAAAALIMSLLPLLLFVLIAYHHLTRLALLADVEG
jgi:ABC-type glycerol-3-phosphate transport system permease component